MKTCLNVTHSQGIGVNYETLYWYVIYAAYGTYAAGKSALNNILSFHLIQNVGYLSLSQWTMQLEMQIRLKFLKSVS